MREVRKFKFSAAELKNMSHLYDGYLWIAIDSRRSMIAYGDDYILDLRDQLLMAKCRSENIYGIGVNLKTGKIDYVRFVNRRNPSVGSDGEVPDDEKERIEALTRYFMRELEAYKTERKQPRYSKKPSM